MAYSWDNRVAFVVRYLYGELVLFLVFKFVLPCKLLMHFGNFSYSLDQLKFNIVNFNED